MPETKYHILRLPYLKKTCIYWKCHIKKMFYSELTPVRYFNGFNKAKDYWNSLILQPSNKNCITFHDNYVRQMKLQSSTLQGDSENEQTFNTFFFILSNFIASNRNLFLKKLTIVFWDRCALIYHVLGNEDEMPNKWTLAQYNYFLLSQK